MKWVCFCEFADLPFLSASPLSLSERGWMAGWSLLVLRPARQTGESRRASSPDGRDAPTQEIPANSSIIWLRFVKFIALGHRLKSVLPRTTQRKARPAVGRP